ncbi:MaoC family dehydratase N-terminal domain-containing protein, partial [Chloroflexota bacterium]
MEQKTWDEQKRWDEEKWPGRKESVYNELFFRKAQEGERSILDVTEKDIEQMRKDWVGVRTGGEGAGRVFNQECNVDNLRHMAQGDGNLNPLYYDPEYAKKTRWGSVIGSPNFNKSAGTSVPQEEARKMPAGVTRGLQGFYSGDECYYYRPVRPGDFVWRTGYLYDAQLKKSQFSGQTIFTWQASVQVNQKGE